MRRLSKFERDLQGLHGRDALEFEIVNPAPGRGGVARPGLRLVVAALGLFWGLILLGVLVVAVVAVIAAVWP